MSEIDIHKTAVVDPNAQISNGVSVGPYSVIGSGVVIGENVKIGAHCIFEGNTTVGKNCQFFSGAIVGSAPQDKKYSGEDDVALILGEGNIVREYVTMNPGTLEGGRNTVVGDNNLFMAYSHVAHDCVIGNNCVMANAGTLAGHVTLEDNAIVGGLCAIHQFARLGRLSIVGGCSKVVQDVPPYSMCDGHPAKVYNLNFIGLKRTKIPSPSVHALKKAYKILFYSGLSKIHAIEEVEKEVELCPEIEHLLAFAKTTKRGLCRS